MRLRAQIASVVSEIAAFAEEEAVGLREVNSAVNQMDHST
jgi:methyl-accepting chemotaxis protein